MGKLEGRVAIVTGGAQGIGYGSAKVLGQQGAAVILVDYSETVEQSAQELRNSGLAVEALRLDVQDQAAVAQAIEDIVERYGKIDILFNNAGVNRRRRFEYCETETRDFIFGVNIMGVWNMTHAVYPYMMKAKYGRIINTSSVTGTVVADTGQTAYCTTKAAVAGFTKGLAYEAAAYGITVNAICPGWVRTPMAERSAALSRPDDPEGALRDMAAFIPMKRLCLVEEVGDLVAFLGSDESKYITGTQIVIDGGSTLPETVDIQNMGLTSI
jgi:hypothetical protein